MIPPDEADAIVAGCALIGRVRSDCREIVTGPIDLGRQYWISVDRPLGQPSRRPQPDVRHFDEPATGRTQVASTKPFGVGLFTSTGFSETFGMWWLYLESYRGSTLFPEPWTIWHVDVADSTRVLEVSSAVDWAAVVSSYPIEHAGMLFPDWASIGERWDGVHMTVSAVAASQAVGLDLGDAPIAPTNWDVESTLWLRWKVAAATPVG